MGKNVSTVTGNILFQILGKISSSVFGLLITLLLARDLGNQGYGEYLTATSIVVTFFLFVDFGINASVVREGSLPHHTELPLYIGSALLLRFVLGVVSIICIWMFALFSYTAEIVPYVVLASSIMMFHGIILTCNAVFQSKRSYQYQTVAVFWGWSISFLSLLLFSILGRMNVFVAIFGLIIGYFIQAAISVIYAAKVIDGTVLLTKERTKTLFFTSLPFGALLIVNSIYAKADHVQLSMLRPPWELGVYGYAYKYFDVCLTLSSFMINAIYPVFIHAHTQGKNALRTTIYLYSKKALLLSIALLVVVYIFSPLISLFGNGYAQSSIVLRTLSLGLPFFFLSNIFLWALLVVKAFKQLIILYGVVGIAVIGINYFGIQMYGLIFPSVTTVVSEAVICGVLWYITKKFI